MGDPYKDLIGRPPRNFIVTLVKVSRHGRPLQRPIGRPPCNFIVTLLVTQKIIIILITTWQAFC